MLLTRMFGLWEEGYMNELDVFKSWKIWRVISIKKHRLVVTQFSQNKKKCTEVCRSIQPY